MSALFPNTDGDDLYEEIKSVNAVATKKDGKRASPGQRKQQQRSTGILKKLADRHDDTGQEQSSPRYLEFFNSVLPSSVQKSRVFEPDYQVSTISGVHSDEGNDTYSYAVSHDVVRKFDITDELMKELEVNIQQTANSTKTKTASLHDDYAQCSDRLSASGNQTSNGQQSLPSYSKPIFKQKSGASTNPELLDIPPELEEIYAFAKDVENQSEPMQVQEHETETDGYDHLHDATQKSSLHNYDHVTIGPESIDMAVDNADAHHHSDISLPQHQYVNMSNDDIIQMSGNKMPCVHQPELVPDYDEPWDLKMSQQKPNILIKQAKNRHIKRPSIDNTYQDVIPKVELAAVDKPYHTKLKSASVSASVEDYKTSWVESVSLQKHIQSDNRLQENVEMATGPNQTHPGNYYSKAWSQQKAPEIKLVEKLKLDEARRSLSSQWQEGVSENNDGVAVSSAKKSALNSPNRLRTVPNCSVKSGSYLQTGLSQEINMTIPLEDQIYYHGAIKRLEAEKKLLWYKEGGYLVRRSESSKDDYSLTFSGVNGVAMHIKIVHKPDGRYILGENSPPFMSIPEIVDYYTKHKLPVQNADRICLIYPIHS